MSKIAQFQPQGEQGGAAFVAGASGPEPLASALPEPPRNGLAPSLTRRRLQVFLAMILADTVTVLGSFGLAGFLYLIVYRGLYSMDTAMLSAYLLLPILLTIGLYNGTYSGAVLNDWQKASWRVCQALLTSALLLNFFAFFAKMNADFSRVAFALSTVLAMAGMTATRIFLASQARRIWGKGPLNRLLIIAGGPPVTLPDAYRIDASAHGLEPHFDDPAALNRLASFMRNMDQVLVSCPEDMRSRWSQVLKGAGIHAEVVSPIAREIGALGIRHYGKFEFSTLIVSTGTLRLRDRILKRAFDLVVSALALMLLSPLMLLTALAIKLQDGGPIFFRQRRVGRGNHFFYIYKFRSMSVEQADAEGARSACREDLRVTSVGRWIRRTSIDELPQLYNVLRGEMSIVGPRPHALGSQAGEKLFWQIDERYWERHALRPGITGLAQIRGYRGATDEEVDLSNRLQSDLEYLRDWSLWGDVAIIFATLRVLRHERAY